VSSFSKAAMARSGSPRRAATRARISDFERAFHRLVRAFVKNHCHPVTGGDLDQTGGCFGVLKLLGRANGSSQFINRRALSLIESFE